MTIKRNIIKPSTFFPVYNNKKSDVVMPVLPFCKNCILSKWCLAGLLARDKVLLLLFCYFLESGLVEPKRTINIVLSNSFVL